MRNYPIKLDDWGITWERYKELQYRCRQYRQWIAKRDLIYAGFNDVRLKDGPRGSGTGDPSASRALRALKYSQMIEQVEQAAIAADGELYPYILKNVTAGVPIAHLDCPCGQRQFCAARRKFFVILDEFLEKGNSRGS